MISGKNESRTDSIYTFGILVLDGYVQAPEILYCPTFTHGNQQARILYLPQGQDKWRALTSGTGLALGYNAGFSGYVSLYAPINARADNIPLDPAAATFNTNGVYAPWFSTLDNIASYWQKSTVISPAITACANYKDGYGSYPSKFWSHKGAGMNAVMFDGSVRWITLGDILTTNPPTLPWYSNLQNDSIWYSTGGTWFRSKCKY